MAMSKIERIDREIQKTREKITEYQNKLKGGGHFAAYPPKLAETCIKAGCPKGGVVIDPFLGSGTTAAVAKSLDRHYIGIELNIEYCALARARIGGVQP